MSIPDMTFREKNLNNVNKKSLVAFITTHLNKSFIEMFETHYRQKNHKGNNCAIRSNTIMKGKTYKIDIICGEIYGRNPDGGRYPNTQN